MRSGTRFMVEASDHSWGVRLGSVARLSARVRAEGILLSAGRGDGNVG